LETSEARGSGDRSNLKKRPFISIIVPAYNAAETLGECLAALLDQSIPRSEYEVIVVDDGSTDATQEVVKKYGVLLLTQANQGPAAARNLGVSHAQGEILLFTDADCAPARNWIEAMVAPFVDPEIVGVKGVYKTWQKELVACFVQLEYEDKYDKMCREPYIDFIDTYSAAYRKAVFQNNGGFDPAFPRASGEDIDFSWRLSRRGCKMVFVPSAVVYHRHVASVLDYVHRKYYVGYWRVLMYRHHPGKMMSDSHTPQALKLQVALAGLLVPTLLGAILWRGLLWVPLAITGIFLASTLPFDLKAARKDLTVATVTPGLLFLRAIALGIGFAVGLFGHLLRGNLEDASV